jgi:hypothetical protein
VGVRTERGLAIVNAANISNQAIKQRRVEYQAHTRHIYRRKELSNYSRLVLSESDIRLSWCL